MIWHSFESTVNQFCSSLQSLIMCLLWSKIWSFRLFYVVLNRLCSLSLNPNKDCCFILLLRLKLIGNTAMRDNPRRKMLFSQWWNSPLRNDGPEWWPLRRKKTTHTVKKPVDFEIEWMFSFTLQLKITVAFFCSTQYV